MKGKRGIRVLAFILSMSLAFSPCAYSVAAQELTEVAETNQSSDIVSESETVVTETQETESDNVPETELTVEESIKTEESEAETESLEETEESVQAEQKITGFEPLPDYLKEMAFMHDGKPSEKEAIEELPETLTVYLNGSEEKTEIPVTWEAVGDYDHTSWFYYQFNPVWDTTIYSLETVDEVPYIGVWLVRPMLMSVSGTSNEDRIYQFLKEEIGLNTAAACGILANIQCESSFNPNEYGDNGTSYGITQWHNTRFDALKKYCAEQKLDYETLEGQLAYLKYELDTQYPNMMKILRGVENNGSGAYTAGYYWCAWYEIPANTKNVAVTRGNLAKNRYWPEYSTTGNVTTGTYMDHYTVPSTMRAGSSFSVRGEIHSSTTISTVTAAVYNVSGQQCIGQTATVNGKSYDLRNIDTSIKFGQLVPGGYTYKVIVKDTTGSHTLAEQKFMVLSNEPTISTGIYTLAPTKNPQYAITADGDDNAILDQYIVSDQYNYEVNYDSNGYYTVRHMQSGKYLTVENKYSAAGSNVQFSTEQMRWQFLPDTTGAYFMIPESTHSYPSCALTMESGQIAAKTSVQIENFALSDLYRFTVKAPNKQPVISGQIVPQKMIAGNDFTVGGIISTEATLKSVEAAVYTESNQLKTGKTVNVSGAQYNLKNLNDALAFNTLSAGIYYYRVTATDSNTTARILNVPFVVLAKDRTVANGIYYISPASDIDYVCGLKDGVNEDGTKIVLAKKESADIKKFTVTYKSDGYYTITNVKTGQSLNHYSISGSRQMVQSKTVKRWQILSSGSSTYYLIPEGEDVLTAQLSGDAAANTGIKMLSLTGNKNQQWKLVKAEEKAKISGQTLPASMNKGTSFSIRGTISSESKITSVTVGVYNTAGSQKIGKTVTPNAKTYDLKNVDTSIKFGTLGAGVYRYVVKAKNAAGEATLVDKKFAVLSTSRTVADGTYWLLSSADQNKAVAVANSSKTNGANIGLIQNGNSNYSKFKVTHKGSGYYKIVNVGSGKYLTVKGQSKATGTNIEQNQTELLWQILSDGKGAYYFVPKCSTGCAMNISGSNINSTTINMNAAQRFVMKTVANPAKLSNVTKPATTFYKGSSFSIRGTVTSESKIKSITVAVYNSSNKQVIGKTVSPYTKTYDLKKVDSYLKFGSLGLGSYKYVIKVKNDAGTKTLLSHDFTVKSKMTLSGVAKPASTMYQGQSFSIKGTIKSSTKIKSVTVAVYDMNNKQIIGRTTKPYKLSYDIHRLDSYLKFGNLKTGTYKYVIKAKNSSGTKTLLTHKFTVKAMVSASGASKPGTLSSGQGFVIKGTLQAGAKMSSITVGVYDQNDKMVIGKTVKPYAKSYNLASVDSSVKFGQLKKGTYRYKVKAVCNSKTYTVINHTFKVN